MMGIVAKDVFMDYDEPVFLSCIMLDIAVPNSPFTVNRIAQSRVTVKNQNPSTAKGELRIGRDTTRIKASIRVTPVFLRALSHLYPSGKHGLTVHVQEGTPPPDREMVRRCLQDRDDPATMQQDLRLEI
jgi:hypothetical protein